MNVELPEVARELGATAARAIEAAGGVDLARRAEVDPGVRDTIVRSLLDALGAFDIGFGEDADSDAAAAELCRIAGRYALPFPLPAVLAPGEAPLALVDPARPRADHGDLFPRWRAATIDGTAAWDAEPAGDRLATKLGAFTAPLGLTAPAAPVDVVPVLVLAAWQLLGAVERAVELTVEHVTTRRQFDQALAGFQAVQFQLADAMVAARSLRELAQYTLWRGGLVDALALRVHALEVTTQVLRTCQQLHGAIGLCDEHDLSVLVRHAQPLLRQPCGLERTTEHLLAAVEADGFDSLFSPARA